MFGGRLHSPADVVERPVPVSDARDGCDDDGVVERNAKDGEYEGDQDDDELDSGRGDHLGQGLGQGLGGL